MKQWPMLLKTNQFENIKKPEEDLLGCQNYLSIRRRQLTIWQTTKWIVIENWNPLNSDYIVNYS